MNTEDKNNNSGNSSSGAGEKKTGEIYPKDEVILVQEAMNLLENKKFKEADEVCDIALKINPNYAAAYIGKLMADLHVRHETELKEQNRSYEKNENYRKALECANETMAAQLRADLEQVKNHTRQVIFIFFLVFLLLCGTGIYLVVRVIIPERERFEDYQHAKQLIDAGQIDEAGDILKKLGDYLDSDRIMATDPRMRYMSGRMVDFGAFDQDDNPDNGNEPIEWIILKNDGEKLLLLARKGLAYRYFHPVTPGENWENSYIREWLNSYFLDEILDDEQKKAVVPVKVDNSRAQIVLGNPEEYEDSAPTTDSVFLLSQKEKEEYLDRLGSLAECVLSESALREGSEALNIEMEEMIKILQERSDMEELGLCDVPWWLRTVRKGLGETDVVLILGNLTHKYYGYPQTVPIVAVRPAMWVKIDEFK